MRYLKARQRTKWLSDRVQIGKELPVQSYWKSKGLGVLWLLCIFWLPDLTFGATETVFLPVTLEYPFIRSVLVHQLYNAPGRAGDRH